jgi:hypothetical protein
MNRVNHALVRIAENLFEKVPSLNRSEPSQSPDASLTHFPTDVEQATVEQPQMFWIAQVAPSLVMQHKQVLPTQGFSMQKEIHSD